MLSSQSGIARGLPGRDSDWPKLLKTFFMLTSWDSFKNKFSVASIPGAFVQCGRVDISVIH